MRKRKKKSSKPESEPQKTELAGKVIGGKYRLEEIAGTGGMANVWRATMRGPGRFQRTVAIKHMHPHLIGTQQYRDMFFEEARVGAELQDPNIAQIYDFIEEDGQYYLIMEWVDGINLATYIRYVSHTHSHTRWEVVAAVGIGLMRGLAAAHERTINNGERVPILHRDVSPHNVLVSVKGPAKLIDFGLALASDRLGAPTPPDVAKGKLAYLAPEVVRGERSTPLSDQFAAGNLLWEALVGRKLFVGKSDVDVYNKVLAAKIEPLIRFRPDTPKRLVRTITRALKRNPAKRFPNARQMALELGAVLKTAESRVDFYELLAETVCAARVEFQMGLRTQVPYINDELPSEESEIEIELKGKSINKRFFERIPFFNRQ